MNFLRNLFSLIGVIVVAGIILAFAKFDLGTKAGQAMKLDPQAMSEYMKMFDNVLATGNAAEAMVRKVKVTAEDVTLEDIEDTMKEVAAENNMLFVGESKMPINPDYADKFKYIKILSFCNPLVGNRFIEYSHAFGAFMPCRVIVVQDNEGIWLYTMAMELMLHGGYPLPDDMVKLGTQIRDTMYSMQDKAASGEI